LSELVTPQLQGQANYYYAQFIEFATQLTAWLMIFTAIK